MSPRTVVEEAVHGKDGDITVRREGERVTVRWTCGGTRSFDSDKLAEVIGYLEKLSGAGIWSLLKDSDAQQFVARIKDGTLSVGDGVRDTSSTSSLPTVPWEHLKAAATDALKAPARPNPAKTTAGR